MRLMVYHNTYRASLPFEFVRDQMDGMRKRHAIQGRQFKCLEALIG